jgi:hypothetical protein
MSRFSLAAIAAIALVVAACSPEPSASEAPAGGASSAGAAGGGSGQVDVSLVDFEIDMPESVPAGEVTFNVTNDGGTEHGFEIEGSGIEEEIEELAPGDSDTLTVARAGHLHGVLPGRWPPRHGHGARARGHRVLSDAGRPTLGIGPPPRPSSRTCAFESEGL